METVRSSKLGSSPGSIRQAGPDNLSLSSWGLKPLADLIYCHSKPMNTYKRSSSRTASCAPRLSSCSGFGCKAGGAWDARGGMDTREARGADVGGRRVTSGFHGAKVFLSISSSHAHFRDPQSISRHLP